MRNLLRHWRWLVPLLMFSADACAWGLYTHVHFAQLLLWAVPLTDARCRRAVAAFPRLVLAGACLPDLSLTGRHLGVTALDETHRWERVHEQVAGARDDAELALAIGFASHLLADVIAHNHFVPAHERLWANQSMRLHVAAEWAMDAHIARHLFVTPSLLLDQHRHESSAFVARHFGCRAEEVWHSARLLSKMDALLRASRLPQFSYRAMRMRDNRLPQRFNHYLRETAARMAQINRILAGEAPGWHAEFFCMDATRARIGLCQPQQIRGRMPLPLDLFQNDREREAMIAPIAAPASTSEG